MSVDAKDTRGLPLRRVRLATLLGLAALIGWLGYRSLPLAEAAHRVDAIVRTAGPIFGPAIFVLAAIAGVLVLFPFAATGLAGGYLFGPVRGFVLVSLATTVGSLIPFLLGRTILRRRIEDRMARDSRWATLDRAISRRGGWVVLLLRVNPIIPFNLSNYLYGLTGLSFRAYVVSTWLGMMPITLAVVVAGSAAHGGELGGWRSWSIVVAVAAASLLILARLAARELVAIESLPVEEDRR